ncbi:HEAT repeat domain-containing protein [Mangrovicoccus algicola]|uniref:HEAT repeat domain-containing protein n=1 Tax=Mangrovicoccus algicola TaxID=2771008 RepID=A0A8J7CXE8_9RHOB|nr:HEAT repeat domain-containing protein [Mangrovicoccus algicola]MBE3638817.1 HEAT repeat domain-containing protein [Mangrovicoccus algicola]
MRPFLLPAILLACLAGTFARAQAESGGYVGSDSCTGCHEAETAAWERSHHAAAWTEASAENIRADFGGTSFDLGAMHAAFGIAADGTRQVTVTELDGSVTQYDVQSVVGIEPLQQYLLETGEGRRQSFDVVWDTEAGRWFHLYPDQSLAPADALHWSGPYKNWDGRCAVCHATDFAANYDPATRSYAATQSEIGVGCEACHGPGQAHLDWARDWETTQEPMPAAGGFPNDPSAPGAFMDTCGGCHSRREAYQDSSPLPGTPYHDAYNLAQLRPGLYWPDGQIRDEVYVLGSFLQSKMHEKGVTCTNCHDAHSGERLTEDNSLCTQCHSPAGNPDFPSLPLQVFDAPEHHHHPEGSPGAQCRACHMPEQVYMGNDARADHSFRVPRPDLSAETGAPDACTACHDDRSPAWAADILEDWFPDSTHRGPHFGQILARGTADPAAAAGDLALLARSEEPGIVRATALWMLGQGGGQAAADAVAGLLQDPDPMVRAAAVDAQRGASAQAQAERLAGLLDDPSRNVRIAAAKAMLALPVARFPDAIAQDLRRAQGDWQAAMQARLGFPETHLQIGGMALTMRNFPAALQAFGEVTDLDPQHVDAWVMQARLAAALEGPEAARHVLDRAVSANPGDLALAGMLSQLDGTGPRLTPPPQ